MPISPDTQKAIDHYKAVRDLIGEEDIAFLKQFLDYAARNLPEWSDGQLIEFTENGEEPVHDDIMQGWGLLHDIVDPDGIARQDESEGEEA